MYFPLKTLFISILFGQVLAVVQNPLPTYRLLFIGNSLTIRNNLPLMVQTMIRRKVATASFTSLAKPSASLSTFANSRDVLRLLQSPNAWTHVILQEQSQKLSLGLPFERTYVWPFAKTLESNIEPNTTVLLYQTMANSGGSGINDTFLLMQNRVIEGYKNLDGFLGRSKICPVGLVWIKAMQNFKRSELYVDSVHPTKRGTYLVSLVFYKTITGRKASSVGISYVPSGVSRSFARKAQSIVDLIIK